MPIRTAGRFAHGRGLGHCLRKRGRVTGRFSVSEHGGGFLARLADEIDGNLDIDRPLRPQAGYHRAIDLLGRPGSVGQHLGAGGHLPVGVDLGLVIFDQVVHQHASVPEPRVRRAADDDHRHALGVRPGHGIEHAEAAHAIGDHDRGNTADAGIPVRGIPRVEFIGRVDQL
jgi:hypothetical protein